MKGRLFKTCVLFITIGLFLLMIYARDRQAAYAAKQVKPVFTSSFIQYEYCKDFDFQRWTSELSMLKKAGVNEIILQSVVDTKSRFATYPTEMKGYSHGEADMLNNALTAADRLSMKVRIGTGFNKNWWDKRAANMDWLNAEAATDKEIIDEITSRYGDHPSFEGWYIPYEFCQFTALTDTDEANLNSFFKQIASEMQLKTPGKDIMVSPFYYGKVSWIVPLPTWSVMLRNILKGTGINILALQDSVGAGYNTLDQLKDLYLSTRKETDRLDMKLYAVTETFMTTPSGGIPASQDMISKQLSIEEPYVTGFVAFSLDHYQNANVPSQLRDYEQYYKYYLLNR